MNLGCMIKRSHAGRVLSAIKQVSFLSKSLDILNLVIRIKVCVIRINNDMMVYGQRKFDIGNDEIVKSTSWAKRHGRWRKA